MILRDEAKELWDWGMEYDWGKAEWRARIYDLEQGRREKDRRFTLMEAKISGGYETVQVFPRKMSRGLPIDSCLMNKEHAAVMDMDGDRNVRDLRSTVQATAENVGLERCALFV